MLVPSGAEAQLFMRSNGTAEAVLLQILLYPSSAELRDRVQRIYRREELC